ncbi:hypothetical protein N7454_004569 [Penicillium verhagenii]|nr:hypothetical protein N7454_004569 [Penicillium verhagenii]
MALVIRKRRVQARFWWAGLAKDLAKTVDVVPEYLEKQRDTMAIQDILRLSEGIGITRQGLGSTLWHELGVLMQDFPRH